MKVTEVTAESTTVAILLEPEHPAEIALVNLLNGCGAECLSVEQKYPPEQNVGMGGTLAPLPPRLQITATVKKGTRNY